MNKKRLRNNGTNKKNERKNNTLTHDKEDLRKNDLNGLTREFSSKDLVINSSLESVSNIKIVKNNSNKRKLHKSYIKGWTEDIALNGFARCIMATCNFMSSKLSKVQAHHKCCKGVPSFDKNFCNQCKNYFSTNEELTNHTPVCSKLIMLNIPKSFLSFKKSNLNTRDNLVHNVVEEGVKGNESPTIIKIDHEKNNFGDTEMPEIKYLQGSNEEEEIVYLRCEKCDCKIVGRDLFIHQSKCKSTITENELAKNLHFTKIKNLKADNKDNKDDHIVQPGPKLIGSQYQRRRPYSKQHKSAWKSTLEKFKYIKCIFQNCYFIAMSLEDMISHFGYCNGDASHAKFICPHCNGRVTSEEVLLKHIERSHVENSCSNKTKNQKIEEKNVQPRNTDEVNISKVKKCTTTRNQKRKRCVKNSSCEANSEENFPKVEEQKVLSAVNEVLPVDKEDSTNKTEEVNAEKHTSDKSPSIRSYTKKRRNQTVSTSQDNTNSACCTKEDPKTYGKINSKKRKTNFTSTEDDEVNSKKVKQENEDDKQPVSKKRGRKPNSIVKKNVEKAKYEKEVNCGKCDFKGTLKTFVQHNLKKHVGLGWIEGEEPVDLNDEKKVIQLVKAAFKSTKKGVCETCNDVKRSFMGFVTHIQNCGKSTEERDKLKVQCPHCLRPYLKYSLPVHIKLVHSAPIESEKEGKKEEEESLNLSKKRKSAVKAATKFLEDLKETEELEIVDVPSYVFYEKGASQFPKICTKLANLWYKLKREDNDITCVHSNCKITSQNVKDAKLHHFNCPELPDQVYMCQVCEFYSINEPEVQLHVETHRRWGKHKRKKEKDDWEEDNKNFGDEEGDEEVEESDGEDESGSESVENDTSTGKVKKRKKKKKIDRSENSNKVELDEDVRYRKLFCQRENLENLRGTKFYCNGLSMTKNEEDEAYLNQESWSSFHTRIEDWSYLPPQIGSGYLPNVENSISFSINNDREKNLNWRKLKRFEGDLVGNVPTMFMGGSVRSISWCKISPKNVIEKLVRQYLAVATSKSIEHCRNIHERSLSSEVSVLQIWDCGALENSLATEAPQFVLGILHESEIWNLEWFPQDLSSDSTNENLARLGMLATASDDGIVRVWSICDPNQLVNEDRFPIYQTTPVAKLVSGKDLDDSCFQVAVGNNGILAGGYGNGVVALWALKNLSSPFTKKEGKCFVIKPHLIIWAHKAATTVLTFCPNDSRYIASGGLDRFIKVWDLHSPQVPIEQYSNDLCLNAEWPKIWPSLIYNVDETIPNVNKAVVKFIRDLLYDRHQSCLLIENACLSISFSDWLNSLCGCSNVGEVKVRFLKNFIHHQKRNNSQSTISCVGLQKLESNFNENEADEKKLSKGNTVEMELINYEDICSQYGLLFNDKATEDNTVPKSKLIIEEFPIRTINTVSFNPNFKSFTHIAAGYNCGLIRILPLKEVQSEVNVKAFLRTSRNKQN